MRICMLDDRHVDLRTPGMLASTCVVCILFCERSTFERTFDVLEIDSAIAIASRALTEDQSTTSSQAINRRSRHVPLMSFEGVPRNDIDDL